MFRTALYLLLINVCFSIPAYAGFAGFLKADTAATLQVGPFVDSTDGSTLEGGLTISQADVRLTKNGGNFAQKNDATSCTYDEVGFYSCPVDATDTNTEGRLQVVVNETGALLVMQEYQVVNANVYDSLYAAATTDYLQTDVIQISGDAGAADNAELDYDGTGYAKANSTVGTVTTLTGHTAQTGDNFARLGAPAGASVSADIAAVKSDTGAILTDTSAYDTDGEYATAIWNAATITYGGAGTYGQLAEDTGADTNELQGDWVNGGRLDVILDELTTQGDTNEGKIDTVDTNVDAILVDTAAYDTDAEYAAAIWNAATVSYGGAGTYGQAVEDVLVDTNELQTDNIPGTLATMDGKLDTIDDYVDTEVAAILTDTGTTLDNHLTDIKGTGFVKDTNSLVDLPLASNYTAARAGYLDNINNAALSTTSAQTGDSFARLGAPAGASVSADIAANQTDLNSILDDTGTSGVVVADHSGYQKNVAVTAFSWLMVDSTDHVTPETGSQAALRTTGNSQISCDGGAFSDLTNIATINHVASGIYEVDLTAAEMNCDAVVLRFLDSGTADQRTIYLKTSD